MYRRDSALNSSAQQEDFRPEGICCVGFADALDAIATRAYCNEVIKKDSMESRRKANLDFVLELKELRQQHREDQIRRHMLSSWMISPRDPTSLASAGVPDAEGEVADEPRSSPKSGVSSKLHRKCRILSISSESLEWHLAVRLLAKIRRESVVMRVLRKSFDLAQPCTHSRPSRGIEEGEPNSKTQRHDLRIPNCYLERPDLVCAHFTDAEPEKKRRSITRAIFDAFIQGGTKNAHEKDTEPSTEPSSSSMDSISDDSDLISDEKVMPTPWPEIDAWRNICGGVKLEKKDLLFTEMAIASLTSSLEQLGYLQEYHEAEQFDNIGQISSRSSRSAFAG